MADPKKALQEWQQKYGTTGSDAVASQATAAAKSALEQWQNKYTVTQTNQNQNISFENSGLTRDEYDSRVRSNYMQIETPSLEIPSVEDDAYYADSNGEALKKDADAKQAAYLTYIAQGGSELLNPTEYEATRLAAEEAKQKYEDWESGKFKYNQSKALTSLNDEERGYIETIAKANAEIELYAISAANSGGFSQYADTDVSAFQNKNEATKAMKELGYTQEEIDALVEYQKFLDDAETAAEEEAKARAEATQRPVLANIGAFAANLASGIGAANEFIRAAGYIDPYARLNVNSANYGATRYAEAVREQTAANIEANTDNELAAKTLSFLYNVGTSVADSASLIATMGPASIYLMGTNAAASAAKDITERGGSLQQAAVGAVTAGAIEVLTEKFSVDNLLDAVGKPGVLKNMLRQAGVEASEEMSAEVLNTLSDMLNMGVKSNYNQTVINYQLQGMNVEDAQCQALLDTTKQVALSGLAGAISGGVMSGGVSAANSLFNTVSAAETGAQASSGAENAEGVQREITPDTAADAESAEATAPSAESPELQAAVDAFRTSGVGSNETARKILASPEAIAELGVDLSNMTASQQRLAVKGAVAEFAEVDNTVTGGYNDISVAGVGSRSAASSDVIERLNHGENVSIDEVMQIPEIAEAESQNEGTPTILLPGREQVRQKGYASAMSLGSWGGSDYDRPIRQDRRIDIVIGLPGSGKSSVFTDRISMEHGSRVVDVDNYRDYIPEYNKINAAIVHEEASLIKDLVLAAAIVRGENIILSTVGADAEKLAKQISAYKQNGYSVYLHLNELANNKAMARAINRYVNKNGERGRYVSPYLIAKYGNLPTQTYLTLTRKGGIANATETGLESNRGQVGGDLREGRGQNPGNVESPSSTTIGTADNNGALLSGYDWYSNDVANGEKARLVESSDSFSGTSHSAEAETMSFSIPKTPATPQTRSSVFDVNTAQAVPMDVNGNPEGMGAASAGFDPYSALQNTTSQFHAEGANALRVDVPTTDAQGRNISKTASTAMGAEVTTDEGVAAIEDAIVRGGFSYIPIADKSAQQKAEATIKHQGWDAAVTDWTAQVRSGLVSKDLVALGQALYNNALNSGDTKGAVRILTDYANMVRSGAQATQAASMLRKLSPEYQLYHIQRSLDALAEDVAKRYPGVEITIDEDLQARFLEAQDSVEREAVLREVYQNVADQIPSSFTDKFNAWRYLAMLANFRTHIRNIVGNVGFAPVRAMKNAVATGIETAVGNIGKSGIDRTKAILNLLSKSDRALVKSAGADYANASELIMGGGKYADSVNSIVEEYRTIFKSNKTTNKAVELFYKALETARRGNNAALEYEDMVFAKTAYATSLASWLKANGISSEQLANLDDETLAAARAYAVNEAQKATYRDYNQFSDFVSALGKNYAGTNKVGKTVNTLIEGVLPFRRTPANVLMRSIEYSPIGLAKAITYDLSQVKQGNMTAADAIDHIASGLVGTGVVALGMLLAKMGLVTGGGFGDDDDDAIAETTGRQEFALEIAGKSFTLDWVSGVAPQLYVGVELWNALTNESENGISLQSAYDALLSITQPLLDMSMLESLNDLLDSVTYADNKLFAIFASAATSYITQVFPTLFGQIERIGEATREATWIDRTSQLPADIQRLIGKAANKMPGEFQQYEYIDAWGRVEESGSLAQRIINNMLNPSYTSEINETSVDIELQRLVDAGVEVRVPTAVATSTKIDGEYMSAEEYSAYAATLGQLRFNLYDELISSKPYAMLDDDAKADSLNALDEYAKSQAADLVREMRGTGTKDEYAKIEGLSDISVYEAFKVALNDGTNTGDWSNVEALFANGGVPEDVADALGTDYRKNKAVYDAGIDLAEYHDMRDAFKDGYEAATDDNDSTVPDYTAIDAAIEVYNRLRSDNQRDVIDDVMNAMTMNKAAGAARVGIDSETWFDIVNTYNDIDESDANAVAKQTELEYTIDLMLGLTKQQKEYAKDTLTYYTVMGAEASKYNALKDAGLTPERAEYVYELAQNAPVIYSADTASNSERAVWISQSSMDDEEKLAALSTYFSDGTEGGTYKRCVKAAEQGISVEKFTRFWYEYNNGDNNKNYPNYNSKKAYLYAWGENNGYTAQEVETLYYIITHSAS